MPDNDRPKILIPPWKDHMMEFAIPLHELPDGRGGTMSRREFVNHESPEMINKPVKAAVPASQIRKTMRGVNSAGTTLRVKALLRRLDREKHS